MGGKYEGHNTTTCSRVGDEEFTGAAEPDDYIRPGESRERIIAETNEQDVMMNSVMGNGMVIHQSVTYTVKTEFAAKNDMEKPKGAHMITRRERSISSTHRSSKSLEGDAELQSGTV